MSKWDDGWRLGYNSGFAKGYEAAEKKQRECYEKAMPRRTMSDCFKELNELQAQQSNVVVVPDDLYNDYKHVICTTEHAPPYGYVVYWCGNKLVPQSKILDWLNR